MPRSYAAGRRARKEREREPGRHLGGTARAGNRSLAHMREPQRGTKIKCSDRIYTLIQLRAHTHTHADTHIEQVIRQLTAAKVGEAAAQKSARQQLSLPM